MSVFIYTVLNLAALVWKLSLTVHQISHVGWLDCFSLKYSILDNVKLKLKKTSPKEVISYDIY